jgi:hypothetical protein
MKFYFCVNWAAPLNASLQNKSASSLKKNEIFFLCKLSSASGWQSTKKIASPLNWAAPPAVSLLEKKLQSPFPQKTNGQRLRLLVCMKKN